MQKSILPYKKYQAQFGQTDNPSKSNNIVSNILSSLSQHIWVYVFNATKGERVSTPLMH